MDDSVNVRLKYVTIASSLILLVAAGEPASSAPPPPRDLGPMLQRLVTQYGLPGAVGAILQGNRLVAIGSAGVRKVGDRTPFRATDQIHLGSDTKAMTAVLVGRLIDQGKLSFDTTMSQAFPDLSPTMNHDMARVTVRQLLDHNAGFAHDIDWHYYADTHWTRPQQRRRAVQQVLSDPPHTAIGHFKYSNVSYVVLGAIVEARAGLSWEQAIRQQIFGPLGMSTAGFGPPGTPGNVDQPWGHHLVDGQLTPIQSDNPPIMGPAGTVHCSIGDWARFIREILRAAQGNSNALIKPETFRKLTTPLPGQDYAGGWIIAPRGWAGGVALTHSGSNTMWYCTCWIAPVKDFAVLIAANDGSDPAPKAADDGIGALIEFRSGLPASE